MTERNYRVRDVWADYNNIFKSLLFAKGRYGKIKDKSK